MGTTRELLIDAAAALIDEGGPAAVTLREVGRRAGVSHNAPYKHFTDKADLLAAVAARELRALAEGMAKAATDSGSTAGVTGAAKVEACALAYVEWAGRHPARFKLTFGPWEGTHEELGEAAAAATQAMVECVAVAHADGSFDGDPDRNAALVWALGHGAADLSISGHLTKKPSSPDPATLVRSLIERMSRSLEIGRHTR